ncbi:hypothetical protein GALL_253710 [mine drainage metagenome]|uniref:Uncharacterized protein n=1 Tax=mine drainage metagenome TaxID=410659 RepID=A0A1J5RT91_9ZZZZ
MRGPAASRSCCPYVLGGAKAGSRRDAVRFTVMSGEPCGVKPGRLRCHARALTTVTVCGSSIGVVCPAIGNVATVNASLAEAWHGRHGRADLQLGVERTTRAVEGAPCDLRGALSGPTWYGTASPHATGRGVCDVQVDRKLDDHGVVRAACVDHHVTNARGVQMPMHEPLTCGDARRRRSRAQSWMIPPLLVCDGPGLMVRAIAVSAAGTVRRRGFRVGSRTTSVSGTSKDGDLGHRRVPASGRVTTPAGSSFGWGWTQSRSFEPGLSTLRSGVSQTAGSP